MDSISNKQRPDGSLPHEAHSLQVVDKKQINERLFKDTENQTGYGTEMRSLLKRGKEGKVPVTSERQRSLRTKVCGRVRCPHPGPTVWNRKRLFGVSYFISIVTSTGSPISQLFMLESPRLYTQTLQVTEGRALWRPALPRRPKQVLCFSAPAPLPGRGGHVGPDLANYISQNSVHRRHLGRWAVAVWGLALQAAGSVL